MTARIIDGKQVAADMRAELKGDVAKLKEEGAKYYAIECPHCRKLNKIALTRLTGGRRRRGRR